MQTTALRKIVTTLLLCAPLGCATPYLACGDAPPTSEPFADLGSWTRSVGARTAEAQRRFDQGLTLDFAFNHDEAIRCFEQAAELDPVNPMPWWGIALASGPHINNTAMSPEACKRAWNALSEARARIENASDVDRALIEALSARYVEDPPADRRALDEAYAAAMLGVRQRFPSDGDVAFLCAEALMNLQPWDFWAKDGTPTHDTPRIVRLLEDALALHPEHPGLCHLYIHAMEASRTPERAKPAADRLRDLVPDAGHLVHMPSHIDLRLGHYQLASEANERAMSADARQSERFPKAGFYRVYMAHNSHFLSFSAMMEGRSAVALAAARRMVADVPQVFIDEAGPMIDGLMPVVFHTLVRFGRWEEILREPGFAEHLITANATRRYARGVALTALGRVDEAQLELDELIRMAGTLDDRVVGINKAKDVLKIAELMLSGELDFRRGERERGLEQLAQAAAREDALIYMEPPDWMMPVRHAWGAALLEASEWTTAERVFREDLSRFPENGWSLFGLARALRGQERETEAELVEARFRLAWARADVTIASPCFCQPGNGPKVLAKR